MVFLRRVPTDKVFLFFRVEKAVVKKQELQRVVRNVHLFLFAMFDVLGLEFNISRQQCRKLFTLSKICSDCRRQTSYLPKKK